MTRTHLLGAASAAALACFNMGAFAAQGTINGGGSTLAQFDYIAEFSAYNAAATTKEATFGSYWEAGSGTGQQSFLQNDLTCDINKVTGNNSGNCANTPGGANTTHYGASDATLSSTQEATWATSSWGQSAAGNLIQLPSMGVGVSIPVNDTNIPSAANGGNGWVTLSDNDLCGVFSGKITDFSQITDSANQPASGQFKVVYRSDGSGTTFLLTNHLNAVCNSSNTNAGVSFTATTSFASLFGGNPNTFIPNAVGEKGSSGIANYLSGLVSGPVPQALAYLTPDFTTIDPLSFATLSNGQPSALVVAAVFNGKTPYTPTTKNVINALAHAKTGQHLTPPNGPGTGPTGGANPDAWVPLIQVASTGYPIVGYTTYDFAQCYSATNSPGVAAGVIAFLKDHYGTSAPYTTDQSDNGFVAIANSGASKFLAAIKANILANKNAWATDIGDKTACAGLAGR